MPTKPKNSSIASRNQNSTVPIEQKSTMAPTTTTSNKRKVDEVLASAANSTTGQVTADATQHLGRKRSQEDRFAVDVQACDVDGDGFLDMVAVFDGHGGSAVSDHLSFFFHREIKAQLQKKKTSEKNTSSRMEEALKAAVLSMDDTLVGKHVGEGSTLCSVMLHQKTIYSTNVGDSRAVLGRKGGVAIDLTRDHRVEVPKSGYNKARSQ